LASFTTPEDCFSPQARANVIAAAQHAFAALPGLGVALTPGEPECVRAVEARPGSGYWLVAGWSGARILAIARILRDGRVATVGHISVPASDGAKAVTGLSHAGVESLASDIVREHGGRIVDGPVLVHDGPVGREAWLLALQRQSGETLYVFATAGGTYVRERRSPSSQ